VKHFTAIHIHQFLVTVFAKAKCPFPSETCIWKFKDELSLIPTGEVVKGKGVPVL
jgi:hypothetical protein